MSRSTHARFTVRDVAMVGLFAAATSAGALVAIPLFGPVPFTLQVFFVLLAGLVLGPRLGALAMVVYLLVGLVAPVYAGGAMGVGTLAGPAGGYLWGFVVAAAVVGWVARLIGPRRVWGLVVASLAGLVPIYGLGVSWLAWQTHASSLHVVLWLGMGQFLPLDALKICLAVAVTRACMAARMPLPGLAATSRSDAGVLRSDAG